MTNTRRYWAIEDGFYSLQQRKVLTDKDYHELCDQLDAHIDDRDWLQAWQLWLETERQTPFGIMMAAYPENK